MVVLVDKQIYLLTCFLAYITEIIQLFGGTAHFIHLFLGVGWYIGFTEKVEANVAVVIKPFLVIL